MFNAGLQFRFSHEAEIWTWRAPNSMLQYADIQFLEGLVSHFGHGLSKTLFRYSGCDFFRFAQNIPRGGPFQKLLKTSPPSAFCIFYTPTLN